MLIFLVGEGLSFLSCPTEKNRMISVAKDSVCNKSLLCFLRLVEMGNKSQMLKYYKQSCVPAFQGVGSF